MVLIIFGLRTGLHCYNWLSSLYNFQIMQMLYSQNLLNKSSKNQFKNVCLYFFKKMCDKYSKKGFLSLIRLFIYQINQYLINNLHLFNMPPLTCFFIVSASLFLMVFQIQSATKIYFTQSPTWLTSPFCRAGNQAVISTLTGSSLTPVHTFIFSSNLSGVPNLAYGIKGYTPNDWMGQEIFQIKRINLTDSSFTVSIQIYGVTNLWILNVAYLAMDPLFPHHLNSFDNFPINYTSPMVNVTVSKSQPTYFTEIVDYSVQASSLRINYFSLPLSRNKIVLLMTSLNIYATFKSGSTFYPISLEVNTQIINISHYSMSLKLSTKVIVNALRFSQIIFNEDDIISSNKYAIVYEIWQTDKNGGFKAIPSEFVDNFIMAITDFKTIDGKCAFQYTWVYQTINSTFGVTLKPSLTNLSVPCAFDFMTSSIFYLKTWQCNSPYNYFNLTSNLCQDLCAEGYYELPSQMSCQPCQETCLNCQSTNPLNCSECDLANDKRQLDPITNQCVCLSGFMSQVNSSVCIQCLPITGCLVCKNNTHCLDCDQSSGYSFNDSLLLCFCSDGYYNTQNSLVCLQCGNLQGCLVCKNQTNCKKCDESSNYLMDVDNQVCVEVTKAVLAIKFSLVIGLVSIFLLLVIKNSLPTAQLISAIQLCYLSLGTVNNLHPFVSSMRWLIKPILGYNPNFRSTPINQISQTQITQLYFQSSLLHNINVMLFIQYFLMIVFLVFAIAVKRWQKLRTVYLIFQKQLLLIIIFNAPNLLFSVPLMSQSQIIQVIIAAISLLLMILQFVDLFSTNNKYLGFDETFDKKSYYNLYILFWVVIRFICSALVTILRDSPKKAILLIFIFQSLSVIILTILQSYRKTETIICVIIGEICLLLFVSINLAYIFAQLINGQHYLKVILSIFQIVLLVSISISTLVSAITAFISEWFCKQKEKIFDAVKGINKSEVVNINEKKTLNNHESITLQQNFNEVINFNDKNQNEVIKIKKKRKRLGKKHIQQINGNKNQLIQSNLNLAQQQQSKDQFMVQHLG